MGKKKREDKRKKWVFTSKAGKTNLCVMQVVKKLLRFRNSRFYFSRHHGFIKVIGMTYLSFHLVSYSII